jgi:hypothetical protein
VAGLQADGADCADGTQQGGDDDEGSHVAARVRRAVVEFGNIMSLSHDGALLSMAVKMARQMDHRTVTSQIDSRRPKSWSSPARRAFFIRSGRRSGRVRSSM